ncbi:MAG TPA: aspartate-semialdehyde dehydrogenase [Chloroflexota bacterium]|nr:aspartate-semialdehyde dehydrogenase [Chloroflexota bacterium]
MAEYRVAVAGATGLVGRTILRVLEERDFPVRHLVPLASERSAGTAVTFRGEPVPVRVLDVNSFEGCDIAFFSAGASVSRRFAPVAAEQALVIDNSSAFRLEPDVPLVVPEVNGDQVGRERRRIVANPNCSTIQMVVALEPLHRAFGLHEVIVSTYQSVSGTGARGIRTLDAELDRAGRAPDSPYPHRIAFNVLPHIDTFDPLGWTGEERKMIAETRKIMRLPDLHVVPTTVRVPVRVGHGEAVYARFDSEVDAAGARRILADAPGVIVRDDPHADVYPLSLDVEGHDEVFVGRLRPDPNDSHALALWIAADNLRKGAATNAVQIAEMALWSVFSTGTVPSFPSPTPPRA